ncbi:MAG: hypothetical protein AB8C02_11220 [Halioglobus sp.]
MSTKFKLAFALYIVNIVVALVIGCLFVFKSEFFSFHSDVIATSWGQVEPAAQILYLGMMRTEGAGYLATAVALTFLLCVPFRRREIWSYWAMTIVGTVEHVPTLLATYHVASVTTASPPWMLSLMLILSLFLALALAIAGTDSVKQKVASLG